MVLNDFRKKVYSQFEEDGITEKIFELIGTTNKICVEFGVETGKECCCRILWEKHGFSKYLFDDNHEDKNINLKKEIITIYNVLQIFENNNIPLEFDLLSVDIDGYDFYVVHQILKKYSPRVLIVESHPIYLKDDKVVMLDYSLKGSYNGASLRAWYETLKDSYDFVSHEEHGINAFFVKKGILNESIIEDINDFDKLYHQHRELNEYPPFCEECPILTSSEAINIVKKINI